MAAHTFYQIQEFMLSDNVAIKPARSPWQFKQLKLLTALIVHPTANKKRARQEFEALVLPCLPASLKHSAAYIIADFYCTGSVFVLGTAAAQQSPAH
jgi:hypothetical protein